MPKRVPISAAKKVAKEHELSQVILVAWDGALMHVVTYGTTLKDCEQAAMGGNKIKAALGFPEAMCHDKPARVRRKETRDA